MAAQDQIPADPQQDAEFHQALATLHQLVDFAEVDELSPRRSNAVYLNSVVLWMLVYQRMSPDSSLEAAVKRLLDHPPDFLPGNKRVVEKKLSLATGAYSRARSRLPLEVATWFAEKVSRSLIEASPPAFGSRRVYTIDGTTITLAPEQELRRAFPPASNQHGEGVWPVALLVVAHELSSGAALLPEIGAMYGPQAVSETALVRSCLQQMPPDGIALADSGFGIFAVAWAAHQAERDFLLRLTNKRFLAMMKQSIPSASGPNFATYELAWKPSHHDRKSHPELPEDAVINVRLHEVRVSESLTLHLVTSLFDSAENLAGLYKRRGDIEIDIRNLKVVLKTENIQARSVDMFRKELLSSMVAYNLVTQLRRQAASLIQEPPRRLSFKRIWTTFRQFLWQWTGGDSAAWRDRFRLALGYAMREKLPNRPGRSVPRESYHRAHKSTHFAKRKPPPIDDDG